LSCAVAGHGWSVNINKKHSTIGMKLDWIYLIITSFREMVFEN
jgi:hypothetical protein